MQRATPNPRAKLWLGLASLALGLATTQSFAQPGQGRGFAGFGQGGGIPFAESTDPRVENRSYHFADADTDLPYCVFVSSQVDENEPAPLIISLHGLGIGPGFMCQGSAIDLAEAGGYILAAPIGYSVSGWYGSPVMAFGGRGRGPGAGAGADGGAPAGPDPADVQRWSEQDVMNVLAMMREEFNVDDSRTYLMGHSMGGAGTLFLGSKHAEEWAAIAPIAPASFLMNDNRAEIKDGGVPVLMIPGDEDEAVPVDNTRMWVATMEELGLEHYYLEFPDVTHGPIIEVGMAGIFAFFAANAR
jgi:poly(3-hydroxybutyrate) depolymerase